MALTLRDRRPHVLEPNLKMKGDVIIDRLRLGTKPGSLPASNNVARVPPRRPVGASPPIPVLVGEHDVPHNRVTVTRQPRLGRINDKDTQRIAFLFPDFIARLQRVRALFHSRGTLDWVAMNQNHRALVIAERDGVRVIAARHPSSTFPAPGTSKLFENCRLLHPPCIARGRQQENQER